LQWIIAPYEADHVHRPPGRRGTRPVAACDRFSNSLKPAVYAARHCSGSISVSRELLEISDPLLDQLGLDRPVQTRHKPERL
jgi:hypothetical protein